MEEFLRHTYPFNLANNKRHRVNRRTNGKEQSLCACSLSPFFHDPLASSPGQGEKEPGMKERAPNEMNAHIYSLRCLNYEEKKNHQSP